jgi:hypothetical protein
MNLERELRENLQAAAEALVVPDPRMAAAPRTAPTWAKGLKYALAGAMTVAVLAVPALLWFQGDGGNDVAVATSAPQPITKQTEAVTTVPPTISTIVPATTIPPEGVATIETIEAGEYTLALVARRLDVEEPPTATVLLQALPVDGGEPIDQTTVGDAAGFFWHTVSETGAVCDFSATPAADGVDVTVQLLLTPSLGCSELFLFELKDDTFSYVGESAEDVAHRFMAAWNAGDQRAMSERADDDVLAQTAGIAPRFVTGGSGTNLPAMRCHQTRLGMAAVEFEIERSI